MGLQVTQNSQNSVALPDYLYRKSYHQDLWYWAKNRSTDELREMPIHSQLDHTGTKSTEQEMKNFKNVAEKPDVSIKLEGIRKGRKGPSSFTN